MKTTNKTCVQSLNEVFFFKNPNVQGVPKICHITGIFAVKREPIRDTFCKTNYVGQDRTNISDSFRSRRDDGAHRDEAYHLALYIHGNGLCSPGTRPTRVGPAEDNIRRPGSFQLRDDIFSFLFSVFFILPPPGPFSPVCRLSSLRHVFFLFLIFFRVIFISTRSSQVGAQTPRVRGTRHTRVTIICYSVPSSRGRTVSGGFLSAPGTWTSNGGEGG